MSVFGGLEDNAPDGGLDVSSAWRNDEDSQNVTKTTPTANTEDPPAIDRPLASAAAKKRRKRLQIHITKVEHGRNGIVVFFDVDAELPRFQSHYRWVGRTHAELKRFADHLSNANPECFVPALPDSRTSHRNAEEMYEQIASNLQLWFDRVCRSPLLVRDDEFLYFVEATTGYVPSVRLKPPASGLARKMVKQLAPPPDDCDELRAFRPQAKMLYQYAGEEFAQKIDAVSRCRRAMARSMQRVAETAGSAANAAGGTAADADTSPASVGPGASNLGTAAAQLGSATLLHRVSALSRLAAHAELRRAEAAETTLGDTMAQVAREAFIIKETLTNRHLFMRDLAKAQASTREKHQRATRLKGAGNISPAKVDEAITQLEQAAHLEKRITTTVHRVTENLVAEKQLALNRIESDILKAISSFVLQSIDCERASLAGWEEGRPDVRRADPAGGLSTLGREANTVTHRRNFSQRGGDEWSDRLIRASDDRKVEPVDDVLDSVQAAKLLAADF